MLELPSLSEHGPGMIALVNVPFLDRLHGLHRAVQNADSIDERYAMLSYVVWPEISEEELKEVINRFGEKSEPVFIPGLVLISPGVEAA